MKKLTHLLENNIYDGEHTKIFCDRPKEKGDIPNYFQVRNAKTDDIVSEIYFQEGSVKDVGLNGISNEDVLYMVMERLKLSQKSSNNINESIIDAIAHISLAIASLNNS